MRGRRLRRHRRSREFENFAFAGHLITHGQPLTKLLTLRKGDQVVVETRAAAIFTYSMDTLTPT